MTFASVNLSSSVRCGFWLRVGPYSLVSSPETAGLSFHVASLDESGLLNMWVSWAHGQWWGTGGDACGHGGRAGGDMYVRGGRALSQETRTRQLAGNSRGNKGWKGAASGPVTGGKKKVKVGDL